MIARSDEVDGHCPYSLGAIPVAQRSVHEHEQRSRYPSAH